MLQHSLCDVVSSGSLGMHERLLIDCERLLIDRERLLIDCERLLIDCERLLLDCESAMGGEPQE